MFPSRLRFAVAVALTATAGAAWIDALRDARPGVDADPPRATSAPFRAVPPIDNAVVARAVQRIVDTADAQGSDFVVIDKAAAELYVVAGDGRVLGQTPVLLGSARGDHTVPGIGNRPIAEVRPEERTTPSGRFVGERGHNARGEDVVWVDYDAAVSIHRVLTTNPRERRLERLVSATPDDNRISYGCVNVGRAFYEAHLQPMFARSRAPIYILPEVGPPEALFDHADRGS